MFSENRWALSRVYEGHQTDDDFNTDSVCFSFTLRPRDRVDFCDLSLLSVWSTVRYFVLFRDDPIGRASFEMDHGDKGLLNGLTVPSGVETLVVDDKVKGGGRSSAESKFTLGGGLRSVFLRRAAIGNAIDVCNYSPRLTTLCLEHVSVDAEELDTIALHVPYLLSLHVESCGVTRIPLDTGSIFPRLRMLSLFQNSIKTLKDVVFPDTLTRLVLSENKGLSVGDAVFPPNLKELFMNKCEPLHGVHKMRLPDGLQIVNIQKNDITWVGTSLSLPVSLERILTAGNPNFDVRVCARHAEIFESTMGMTYSGYTRALKKCNSYNHQDAIVRFLHNNVMCVDLLMHVRGFLE